MHKLLRIDNIMYRVSDLAQGEAFYTQMLGLQKTWEDKERHMMGFTFADRDAEIVIHAHPSLPTFDYSYLVEDVVGFCAEYRAKGYTVAVEPMEVRCGQYAMLSDPDGNGIPIIDLSKFGGKPRYN
jgi:predicted enzyme related to lactoylglutathione lyase